MTVTEKTSCRCFLKYGKHEFVPDLLTKPGDVTYRCIHCSGTMASAIRNEQEYELSWMAGKETEFLKEQAKKDLNHTRWGVRWGWKS